MVDDLDAVARTVARIKALLETRPDLNSSDVAAVLKELQDQELGREIVSQYLLAAALRGDVDEVMAWAVVLSYYEGRSLGADVQAEVLGLITHH